MASQNRNRGMGIVVFLDIKCAPPAKRGRGLEKKNDFGGHILRLSRVLLSGEGEIIREGASKFICLDIIFVALL